MTESVSEFNHLVETPGLPATVLTHMVDDQEASLTASLHAQIKEVVDGLEFAVSSPNSFPNGGEPPRPKRWEEIQDSIVFLVGPDSLIRQALCVWALDDIWRLPKAEQGANLIDLLRESRLPCPFVVEANQLHMHLTNEHIESLAESLCTATRLRVPTGLAGDRGRLDKELDRLLRSECMRFYVHGCEKVQEGSKLWAALRRVLESPHGCQRQIVLAFESEPQRALQEEFRGFSACLASVQGPEDADDRAGVCVDTSGSLARGHRLLLLLLTLLLGMLAGAGTMYAYSSIGQGSSPRTARTENASSAAPTAARPADAQPALHPMGAEGPAAPIQRDAGAWSTKSTRNSRTSRRVGIADEHPLPRDKQ